MLSSQRLQSKPRHHNHMGTKKNLRVTPDFRDQQAVIVLLHQAVAAGPTTVAALYRAMQHLASVVDYVLLARAGRRARAEHPCPNLSLVRPLWHSMLAAGVLPPTPDDAYHTLVHTLPIPLRHRPRLPPLPPNPRGS